MNVIPKAKKSDYGYHSISLNKPIIKILSVCFVIMMFLVLYLPVIVIAIQSINASTLTSNFGDVTLRWYVGILSESDLLQAIKNTLTVSLIAVMLATVLGTMFAIGIHQLPKKKQSKVLFLNQIPILNADIVTGFSLMIMFRFLMFIFPNIFGLTTLILAHLFFTLPYVIINVLPKLRALDPNYLDAAMDLGVKPFKAMYLVMVPAIRSGILSGMIIALTMSIDDFVISFFNTGAGYDNLSIWIYGVLGRRNLSPSVYAFSTLLTLITGVLLISVNLIKKEKIKNK